MSFCQYFEPWCLDDISKQLELLHNKIDYVIRHLNLPAFDGENSELSSMEAVHQQQHQATQQKNMEHSNDQTNHSVMLEGLWEIYSCPASHSKKFSNNAEIFAQSKYF